MKRRWIFLIEMLLLAGLCAWVALSFIDRNYHPQDSVEFKIRLLNARDKAWICEIDKDGVKQIYYQIIKDDGGQEYLTPEQFTERVYREQGHREGYQRVLNISGPVELVWVAVGLLGQVLFTGRMVVQWLRSEKEKKSVVPPMFWWMSLAGSTMLLVYFMWRTDPIGVLGQAFGWFIYVRNLWLIYRPVKTEEGGEDSGRSEDSGPEMSK